MKPQPLPHDRLIYVDWLRIGAFALLVLYHVGMVYVPWGWHVKHAPTYAALEPLLRLSNPWRMSLLFVVSGLATGLMLGSASARAGFARARSKRLLLPLLLGMALIVPPQAWLQVREQFGYDGGYLAFLRLYFGAYGGFCGPKACLVLPTWNHLWFLPYLWSYTLLALLALRVLPAPWLQRAADALAQCAGWRWLLLPALLLGVSRALLLPRFGETHALIDDWALHAAYGPLFAFGLLLARRRVLLQQLQQLRWPALALGLAGWLVLVGYPALLPGWPTAPEAWRVPMRLAFGAAQWGGVVAAFGFARAHLAVDHRWRAPLSEAVFPLYLVHQTIIIVAAVALRPLALPAGLEALLIVLLSFGGGFTAWRLARRSGWLRPWMGLSARREPGRTAALPRAAWHSGAAGQR